MSEPIDPNRSAEPVTTDAHRAYWRKNQRLIAILLAIWALVSFGFAILFPGTYPIGQLPAGFWWAQQGSIYVFVVLIFVYAWCMDRIDREFDVDERDEP